MQTKTFTRFVNLPIVLSLAFNAIAVVHAVSQSAIQQALTFTFRVAADAYVIQTYPGNNYGTSTSLRVDSSPITRSYLRFVVSGLAGGTVQSAVLRIYANSSNSTGFSVHSVANNNWTEGGSTYNNSPAVGNAISSSKPFNGGTWVDVNVSSYIKTEGTFNLVLITASTTNTSLASRESGTKAPLLVVTSVSQATSMPTTQPTKTIAATSTPTKSFVPTTTPTKTTVPTSTPTSPTGTSWQPAFPIRAAFYYPWFPEAWTQKSIYPYSNYTPQLGYYSSTDQNILKQHIAMMQYGNIQAGIASWWGQGSQTDSKISGLLSAAAGTNFRWALYYENESQGDPSVGQIQNDLAYILNHYGQDPSFLRVNGKFVVFVYADVPDACGMADRWKQADTVGAYIVLKVFPGYAKCTSQPDSWHQYSPAAAADQQGSYSYSISPGFWLKGTPERLARDLNRWTQNVRDMVASGANWQLITTFSEWGEGTIVEPATQWGSVSGYGQYLDVLHTNGR
jgi:Glycosyl hydrolase family 99